MSFLGITAEIDNGAPEESRTPNLQIRSLTLYPIELRARIRARLINTEKPGAFQPFCEGFADAS